MSLEYIRQTYGVPAKRGGRVEYTGGRVPIKGTILGAALGGRLSVRLDGSKYSGWFHPTWHIRYLTQENRNEHA